MHYTKRLILGICLALMLLFMGFSASAQVTMIVNCGDEEGLIAAITTANALTTTDTINIIGDCAFTFTSGYTANDDSALPRITQSLIINGNGSTIERADGSPEFRLLYIESGVVTLNNLTLNNGEISTHNGGLIWASGNLYLNDVTLTDGYAKSGGAIYILASLYIERSTLSNNQATDDGGAIYKDNGTTVIENSYLTGNQAVDLGGAVYSDGDAEIFSTILTGNTAAQGGAVYVINGDTAILNNTVAGNQSTTGSVHTATGTSLILLNTIVWGNAAQITHEGAFSAVINSLVEGGYSTGTNILTDDPLFATPVSYTSAPTTTGDYHLQALSPAINAGSNAPVPTGSYDIDGDERILDSTVDIGADEAFGCTGSVYTIPAAATNVLLTAIACANLDPDANVINLTDSIYNFTADSGTGNQSALPTITTSITINGNGSTLERDGNAPDFRFFSVSGNVSVTLNDLTLTGGKVSGIVTGGAIYAIGSTLTLNRCTITNNSSSSDAGGIYNIGTLTVVDSTISSNTALRSGGIYNGGRLTVINSIISGNDSSTFGGGIYSLSGSSSMVLVNSIVSGNSADSHGGGVNGTGGAVTLINTVISGNHSLGNGGGLYSSSNTVTVLNSTISGNTAMVSGGGISQSGSTTTITNSIIWGNNSQINGTPTVSYSIVEGGFTGTGNLNVDPLFVTPTAHTSAPTSDGFYELQDGSPAIDVGSNAALPVDTYDLDGDSDIAETLPLDILFNTRVFSGVVDMGAYENGAIVNRLTNGSFETAGTTAVRANKWTNTKTKTTDKRLCSTVNKPITTSDGDCVFQFSGGNTSDVGSRAIKQVINAPVWGNLGGDLTLSAKVEGNKFKTGAVMFVQVTYADNTKGKVQVAIPSGTYAFTPITTDALDLTQTVSKAVVTFKIGRTGGRLRIDDIQLLLTFTTTRATGTVREGALPLPLPEVPDGFRGGN